MLRSFANALAAAIVFGLPAMAEIVRSAEDGFQIEVERQAAAPPELVLETALDIAAWWSSDHTYSGAATNLRLEPFEEGGRWIEVWDDGVVEHGRLVYRSENTLRFEASLGPLQSLGLTGILGIYAVPALDEDGVENDAISDIMIDYRVSGSSLSDLDGYAPMVDRVIEDATQRLAAAAARSRADAE